MKNVAVVIIDQNMGGSIVNIGTNDGRVVDKYYSKVNHELYFAASLVRAEDAELVVKLLNEQQKLINQAKERQFQIRTIFNNILTSGLDSCDYPNIRDKEWFKAIKPKQ